MSDLMSDILRETCGCYIPFEGFHYSIMDYLIDRYLEGEFNYIEEKIDEEKLPIETGTDEFRKALEHWFWLNFDNQKAMLTLAKDYTSWFEELLQEIDPSIKLHFNELQSPKYYNYETDKIYALFDDETHLKVITLARLVLEKRKNWKEKYALNKITLQEYLWGEWKGFDLEEAVKIVVADHMLEELCADSHHLKDDDISSLVQDLACLYDFAYGNEILYNDSYYNEDALIEYLKEECPIGKEKEVFE